MIDLGVPQRVLETGMGTRRLPESRRGPGDDPTKDQIDPRSTSRIAQPRELDPPSPRGGVPLVGCLDVH